MWLFDLNLPLYRLPELGQNGIHLLVECGCIVIFLHFLVVSWRGLAFGPPLRFVGKSRAVR